MHGLVQCTCRQTYIHIYKYHGISNRTRLLASLRSRRSATNTLPGNNERLQGEPDKHPQPQQQFITCNCHIVICPCAGSVGTFPFAFVQFFLTIHTHTHNHLPAVLTSQSLPMHTPLSVHAPRCHSHPNLVNSWLPCLYLLIHSLLN